MAFNMFPFTNLHNLNTDWILKTIKELKAAAETAASQVQEALQNAVLYTSQSKDTSSRRVACTNIHAVSYDSTPLVTADAAQARYNMGAAAASEVVKITEQELTDEQKTQARNNIEAADQTTVGGLVRQMTQQVVKVTEQSWSDSQKAQARTNIGAASAAALGELDSAVGLKVDDNNGSATNLTVEGLSITDGEIVTIPISAAGTTNAPVIDVSDGEHATKIAGVANPTSNSHAANKAYVDSKALPAAFAADEGKILTVNGSGDPTWVNSPAVITDTSSTTPTIASAANNTIYKYTQDLTSFELTAGTGSYMICFHSGSTATSTVFPVDILGLDDFVPETYTYYEINIMENRAVWMGWPDPAE